MIVPQSELLRDGDGQPARTPTAHEAHPTHGRHQAAVLQGPHAHRFDRIRINGVNIGWTITEGEEVVQRTAHGATDGWLEEASASQPMGKLGQPDEIADFIVYLLSNRSGVVTGSIIDWDQIVIGGHD